MSPSSRMVTLDSDVFKCCHKIETLGWDNDNEAKNLLQRAADQVKPIMANRKWAVPVLTEFYPPAANLLGMNHNHGQKIEIRLRSPSNKDIFLPYESILGTLLHELVHIEIGPHNAEFYRLLNELQDECDSLIARGVMPESTKSFENSDAGNRLSYTRAPPKHVAKERAIAAATRRQKIDQLMSNRSQKLGGNRQLAEIAALCDPREMALAAAQRRLADEVWCSTASTSTPVASSSTSKTQGYNDVIDVDAPDSNELEGPNRKGSNIDSDDDVVFIEEKKVAEENPTSRPPVRRKPVKHRVPESRIPTRGNPAAMAAILRAQGRR